MFSTIHESNTETSLNSLEGDDMNSNNFLFDSNINKIFTIFHLKKKKQKKRKIIYL